MQNAFSEQTFGLLYKPPDHNKWIGLVIAGRNAMLQNGSGATGHFASKVRELNALGFYAGVVSKSLLLYYKTNTMSGLLIMKITDDDMNKNSINNQNALIPKNRYR